jgi:hypothetical protein
MPIYTQGCGTGVAFDQDLNTTDSVAFAALTVAGAAAVVTTDSRLSDARTPTAHTHPLSDLTQSSATAGQVPSWNGTAWTPSTPTVTTDASLLTSGTLADARLSANVSLNDINNDFSASQTFAGSANTAPNQTAASGSSLMTRDLGDARYRSITPIAFSFAFQDETSNPQTLEPYTYNFLPFDSTLFGSGLSSGNYVAPSTGYYFLTCSVLTGVIAAGNAGLFCFINNSREADFAWTMASIGQANVDGTCLVFLSAGDVVGVALYHTCETEGESGLVYYPIVGNDLQTSFFNGFKL